MVANPLRYGALPHEWDRFAALGVPVLPVVSDPNIPTSPSSKIPAGNRGKVPTALNAQGQVVGIKDWTRQQLKAEHFAKFANNPALGFCVVTGRGMVGIDCDISDATLAGDIKTALDVILGRDFPIRHRANSAKFLVPLFVPGSVAKQVITTRGGKMEFLGTGQQFVAAGTHPSGARIEWHWPESGVPALTVEEFAALVEQLAKHFAVEPVTETKPTTAQPALQVAADVSDTAALEVRRLLARINLPKDNPSREAWLRVGMAAHHHTAGSEAGFLAWHEWSATQPGYAGDDTDCRTRWESFGKRKTGEPVTIGALEQLAHVQTGYTVEECGFDVIPEAVQAEAQAAIEKAADPFADIPWATGAATRPAQSSGKRRLLHPRDVKPADYLKCSYLVKGWLDRETNNLLFGTWNAGKTFVLLDMAACVAQGLRWFGCRVRQGKVLYLGYEGWAGMRKRLDALKTKHPGINDAPFLCGLLTHPLVTAEGRRELGEWLAEFAERYGSPPDLVIIDPMQDALGGDDSDANLVSQLGRLVRVVMRRQGCAVIRVHHTGHNNKQRARGHSSVPAGVDSEIRVEGEDGGEPGTVSSTKQRDAKKSKLGFRLAEVHLGIDEDGDLATSCTIAEAPLTNVQGLTDDDRKLYRLILALAGDARSVARQSVLDGAREQKLIVEGEGGRSTFRDSINRLAAGQYVAQTGKRKHQMLQVLQRGAGVVFDLVDGDE